jgi:glycosyltransferase involved in cell wall biosynthesis
MAATRGARSPGSPLIRPRSNAPMFKVSILIPCYNAERWIAGAIRSALDQTWPNKEIIVVDDGSTDRSIDVIHRFKNAIRFETGPNRGGNIARNRLLELCDGQWVQYLDADDYLLPQKIETQLSEFDPDAADAAYSPSILEYRDYASPDRVLHEEVKSFPVPHDLWVHLVRWWLPQTGAYLWRRAALFDVGGWEPNQPCCQDNHLYFRMLQADKRFQFCPTPGAVYRQWSTATVCKKNPRRTLTVKLDIIKAAELHLQQSGALTNERRDAIALARLECARTLYPIDRKLAGTVAAFAEEMHPGHRLDSSTCFPRAYRLVYHALGFRAAEAVAEFARPFRIARGSLA